MRLANAGSTALMVHSALERPVDHMYGMHWLPAGKRIGRQPAGAEAPLEYAAAMRPIGRPKGNDPCSGGLESLGRHDGFHGASDAHFLVLQRAVAVSSGDGVLRAGAHFCTSTRSLS